MHIHHLQTVIIMSELVIMSTRVKYISIRGISGYDKNMINVMFCLLTAKLVSPLIIPQSPYGHDYKPPTTPEIRHQTISSYGNQSAQRYSSGISLSRNQRRRESEEEKRERGEDGWVIPFSLALYFFS